MSSRSTTASSGRPSGPALALGALAVGAAGTYAAERRAIARWSADDLYRNEPQSVLGDERWVESSDGARLRVIEAGDGPTVVLAHGYTATAHHWAPVASRLLAGGVRVVVFDQRGHGRSSSGSGRFGTAHLAADLAAVLAVSAPDGAVLAGHSMGGIGIQALLAEREPVIDRVHGLVLVATLARPVSVPLGRLMRRLGGTTLARRVMAHAVHGRVLARGGVGSEPALTVLDVVRHGWVSCPDSTRAGVMRDLRDYDFSEMLEALATPTTVICGDLDQVTPLAESRRIAGLVPNARLEIVRGGGHALPWEAADLVADVIAAHAHHGAGTEAVADPVVAVPVASDRTGDDR